MFNVKLTHCIPFKVLNKIKLKKKPDKCESNSPTEGSVLLLVLSYFPLLYFPYLLCTFVIKKTPLTTTPSPLSTERKVADTSTCHRPQS